MAPFDVKPGWYDMMWSVGPGNQSLQSLTIEQWPNVAPSKQPHLLQFILLVLRIPFQRQFQTTPIKMTNFLMDNFVFMDDFAIKKGWFPSTRFVNANAQHWVCWYLPKNGHQQLFGTLPDHFVGWSPSTNHFFPTIHYTSTTISSLWNGQTRIVGCLIPKKKLIQSILRRERPAWADSCKLFSSSSPAVMTSTNGDITIDLTWIHGWYWHILGCDFIGTQQYNFWVWKRVPYLYRIPWRHCRFHGRVTIMII